MYATHPTASERQPASEFERRYGRFGDRERRHFALDLAEVRESGAGNGQFTVVGHAAVFEVWSLDLGFFREKIARGAFDNAIARDPDVWHLWDHDTRYVLSRTRAKTLELSVDPRGLRFWSRVAPTSYAADLRILMERGDVDQSSFAFTVAKDEWLIETDDQGNEQISRTILEVDQLFDVTTTAAGAYPQTDSQIARQFVTSYMEGAGHLVPESLRVAPADPVGAAVSLPAEGTGDEVARKLALAALRAKGRRARLNV